MKSRRGSYTVFLVIFFSTLMILIQVVIQASEQAAISSVVDHFGRLWGTSILAEYDLMLKDRYGLYGFYGDKSSTEAKLDQYAAYSFAEKSYISWEGAVCSLDEYALTEIPVLRNQMEDAVIAGNRPHELHIRTVETEQKHEPRRITSRWILDHLPSAASGDSADSSAAADAVKSGASLKKLMGAAAVNTYIFTYFRHYCSGAYLEDTYFQNEIEYILSGKPDDEKARKNVKQKLVLMRNLLNLAYLYRSEEKREAAMALAAILTPGAEAVLTQGILLELWAYAEAQNDIELLYDGKKVPLQKSDETWALTLEHAMERSSEEPYILPDREDGYGYEVYLRILMNTMSEETRILRAMDLIQINMKYLYCDYFRLENFYAGLSYTVKVNGGLHEFKETYEREQEGQLSG